MAASSKTTLEARGPAAHICVEFEKVGDYFSHGIWLLVGNERIPVFQSCENPNQLHLPCFTELHQQGKNIFLTGANGPCHWSMSVEVGDATSRGPGDLPDNEKFRFNTRYGLNAPHLNPNIPAFQFLFFDIACRLKEDVVGLATVYTKSEVVEYFGDNLSKPSQTCQVRWQDHQAVSFGANADREVLRFDPDPKCLLVCEPAHQLKISTSQSGDKKYPATVQWSYGIWA